MSNEILFAILMFADLSFVLLAFCLGRAYLYAAVIANIMFVNMISSKIVPIFGLDSTVANVFYAAIFLCTDLLNEHHGPRHAVRAVWLGFFALIPLILFAPFVRLFEPAVYSVESAAALDTIFGFTGRIAIASLIAYTVANLFDVWCYNKIRGWAPSDRWLWLRNTGSTAASQLVDHSLFVVLAFAGVFNSGALLEIFISGYMIKIIVAMCDTPFVYIAKRIEHTRFVRALHHRARIAGGDA